MGVLGDVDGEVCTALRSYSLRIGGIVDLATLPVSSADAAEIDALIRPYVPLLPDGAAEQIDTLRAAAADAAGLSARAAADVLDDPAVRQARTSVDYLYGMYCSTG